MTAQQILTADMLDILFESRNKAYGAYAIRKSYATHMYAGVGTVLLFSLLAVAWVQVRQPQRATACPVLPKPPQIVELIPWEEPRPQQPAQAAAAAKPATKVDDFPRIVPDEQEIINPVPDRTEVADYVPGTENSPSTGTGGEQMVQSGAAAQQPPVPQEAEAPVIFHSVEVMPSFPGGEQALYRYLQRMLQVPAALEPGDRKTVQVRFVVNASGEVTAIEILQSGGVQFDREVIRVVERMPRWKPGKQNGRPVSVYFTQPVTFTAGSE
jgi:periplasmic protein TonB